jgi:adenylate cyclase class IV
VHLDRVEGLGQFVELEVVLSDGEGTRPGIEEAEGLMALLGISSVQLLDGAYVDLLAQRQVSQTDRGHGL